MNFTPAKSLQRVAFCTLAGVEDVRAEGNEIVGRWKSVPTTLLSSSAPSRLAEEFANWPIDLANILRFTKRYAPLRAEFQPGLEFRFSVEDWRSQQRGFRRHWEDFSTRRRVTLFQGGEHRWGLDRGRLTYTAPNLFHFLYLDLLSMLLKRLRKCARPDCPHPFFVARHLKQKYCSDLCAAWGQRGWKRRWWAERGNEWRRKHRKAKSPKRR